MTKRPREDDDTQHWCASLQKHWDKEGLPSGGMWTVGSADTVKWETKSWTADISMARLEQMIQPEHKRVTSVLFRFGTGIEFGCGERSTTSLPECAVSAMCRLPVLKLMQVLEKQPPNMPLADWTKLSDMGCLIGKLQGSATSSKLSVSCTLISTSKMYTLQCTGVASMPIECLRLLLRTYRADIDDILLTATGFHVHVLPEAERRPIHFWTSFGVHATERAAFDAPPPKRAKVEVAVAVSGT
jgi:hypothetical protein